MKKLLVLLLLVSGLLLVACGESPTVTPEATPTETSAQATPTETPTVTPTTQPTVAPTQAPTVAPTATTAAQAVTHGTPMIGGMYSDFYGKYGTPHNQDSSNGETWFVSDQPFIMVAADPDSSGIVVHVTVVESDQNTGDTWPNDQMLSYCMQFMPTDATEFNTVDSIIDYNSSIGEIVVQLGPGSCVISMAQS